MIEDGDRFYEWLSNNFGWNFSRSDSLESFTKYLVDEEFLKIDLDNHSFYIDDTLWSYLPTGLRYSLVSHFSGLIRQTNLNNKQTPFFNDETKFSELTIYSLEKHTEVLKLTHDRGSQTIVEYTSLEDN